MRRQKKDVTGRIKRHRKLILELLLAAHCRDCTTCVKSGECNLQRLAHRLGVTQIRFENTRPPREIDDSSPAIIRDPNKCILCGDCIRACEELQGIGALGFAFRGTDAIKEFTFPYEGTELKICVVSGLANARAVMERVKRGEAQYHLIEVMACRRGCIMGGGQPPFAGIRRGRCPHRPASFCVQGSPPAAAGVGRHAHMPPGPGRDDRKPANSGSAARAHIECAPTSGNGGGCACRGGLYIRPKRPRFPLHVRRAL